MTKIERDNSALETSVKPLVEAANTVGWRNALNLLYINGSVMVLSEVSLPVLVSLEGRIEDIKMSLDLLQGKATTAMAPFGSSLLKTFMPGIMSMVENPALADAAEKGDEDKMTLAVISGFRPIFQDGFDDLSRKLIQSGFTLSELLVVTVFRTLSKFRESQIHVVSSQEEYEEIVHLLRRLNIAHPQLQVSVCTNCSNYRLIVSKYSPYSDKCPKCGSSLTTATLYTLDENLSKLKTQNADLSVFISAYLRNKLTYLTAMQEIEIHPNAVISFDGNQEEIDVYLPQFKVAFECKVYQDPFASFTGPHAGGIVGNLAGKILKLSKAGITDIFLVTNLTEEATKRAHEELLKSIREKSLNVSLTAVPRDSNILIATLDGISDKIGKKVTENFGRRIDSAIKRNLAQSGTSKKGNEER